MQKARFSGGQGQGSAPGLACQGRGKREVVPGSSPALLGQLSAPAASVGWHLAGPAPHQMPSHRHVCLALLRLPGRLGLCHHWASREAIGGSAGGGHGRRRQTPSAAMSRASGGLSNSSVLSGKSGGSRRELNNQGAQSVFGGTGGTPLSIFLPCGESGEVLQPAKLCLCHRQAPQSRKPRCSSHCAAFGCNSNNL